MYYLLNLMNKMLDYRVLNNDDVELQIEVCLNRQH